MTDYIKLGMMLEEFREACAAIDERASDASKAALSAAWQSLLDGDTAGRDRHCDRASAVDNAAMRAKQEAWLRIGEKHGFSREDAVALLAARRKLN